MQEQDYNICTQDALFHTSDLILLTFNARYVEKKRWNLARARRFSLCAQDMKIEAKTYNSLARLIFHVQKLKS